MEKFCWLVQAILVECSDGRNHAQQDQERTYRDAKKDTKRTAKVGSVAINSDECWSFTKKSRKDEQLDYWRATTIWHR